MKTGLNIKYGWLWITFNWFSLNLTSYNITHRRCRIRILPHKPQIWWEKEKFNIIEFYLNDKDRYLISKEMYDDLMNQRWVKDWFKTSTVDTREYIYNE